MVNTIGMMRNYGGGNEMKLNVNKKCSIKPASIVSSFVVTPNRSCVVGNVLCPSSSSSVSVSC